MKFLRELLPMEALVKWEPIRTADEAPIEMQQILLPTLGAVVGIAMAIVAFLLELTFLKRVTSNNVI